MRLKTILKFLLGTATLAAILVLVTFFKTGAESISRVLILWGIGAGFVVVNICFLLIYYIYNKYGEEQVTDDNYDEEEIQEKTNPEKDYSVLENKKTPVIKWLQSLKDWIVEKYQAIKSWANNRKRREKKVPKVLKERPNMKKTDQKEEKTLTDVIALLRNGEMGVAEGIRFIERYLKKHKNYPHKIEMERLVEKLKTTFMSSIDTIAAEVNTQEMEKNALRRKKSAEQMVRIAGIERKTMKDLVNAMAISHNTSKGMERVRELTGYEIGTSALVDALMLDNTRAIPLQIKANVEVIGHEDPEEKVNKDSEQVNTFIDQFMAEIDTPPQPVTAQ